MKIDGGCHCGRVTYEAEIDPDKAAICHCTHKKRAIATITIANTMAKIASPKMVRLIAKPFQSDSSATAALSSSA
jgi:hypothetical protein